MNRRVERSGSAFGKFDFRYDGKDDRQSRQQCKQAYPIHLK
jgi:hypothetical protein